MKGGRLRHFIEVQQNKGSTRDSFGQSVDDWQTVYKCWAEILPSGGREALIDGQYRADTSFKLRIRYHAGITVDFRIKMNGRYLSISGIVNPKERNEHLELACRERN